MWSFYNKEILIGIFPSDRDWWEDQWTVWGVWCLETVERVLEASLISWHRHNAAQLWSECAAWVWWHPREVIISHEAIVVITITIITITFHIISWGLMRLNPRNISVFSKQTWDVLNRFWLFCGACCVREIMGWDIRRIQHTALSSPDSLLGPNITFLSDFLSKVAINCVSEIKLFSIKFQ